ncbi:hypothetical protein ACLD02_14850 [Alloalcanivorax sp. C16-2]|uniref:hypothetical protein n=1 Tax=Alloalcanivorax TaxID=3020832 RepID=UPI0019342B9A|nr:hypothetical protein [Alloalcanivorax marinus]MBL7248960.1 hypothetical protein [Alloalcanivorax marinus]
MNFPFPHRYRVAALALAALTLPGLASAYVGPGAGLSLLTALWGIIAAIGVAVLFVILWPIRRLRRRKAQAADESARREADAPADETPANDDQPNAPSTRDDHHA